MMLSSMPHAPLLPPHGVNAGVVIVGSLCSFHPRLSCLSSAASSLSLCIHCRLCSQSAPTTPIQSAPAGRRPLAAVRSPSFNGPQTARSRFRVHCKKYPYISGYFVASFPYILTEPVPYSFVMLNNEARAHTTMLLRRFTDTNVYGNGSTICVYTDIFTVYLSCSVHSQRFCFDLGRVSGALR